MKKQAEYEELVKSCDSLSTEQMDLKSELDQLKADAKKLRIENAALRVLPHRILPMLEPLIWFLKFVTPAMDSENATHP